MSVHVHFLSDLDSLPICESAFCESAKVSYMEVVRAMSSQDKFGIYGRPTWASHPALASLDACKARCLSYKNVFVFTTLTNLKSSYDIKGWAEAAHTHELLTKEVAGIFRSDYADALVLAVGACNNCDSCTYPEAPCRNRDEMLPSIEAYGILVTRLARDC